MLKKVLFKVNEVKYDIKQFTCIVCLFIYTYISTSETWTKGKTAKFGYDFWYQPYWDVLVASEWGTPKYFKTGFYAEHVNDIGIFYK